MIIPVKMFVVGDKVEFWVPIIEMILEGQQEAHRPGDLRSERVRGTE